MAFVNQRIAVAEQYVEGCVHIPQAGRLDHATVLAFTTLRIW